MVLFASHAFCPYFFCIFNQDHSCENHPEKNIDGRGSVDVTDDVLSCAESGYEDVQIEKIQSLVQRITESYEASVSPKKQASKEVERIER